MVKRMKKKMNKKGWVKIVEAFVGILIITGVLLVVLEDEYVLTNGVSKDIYDSQLLILRDIQVDDTMREDILGVDFSTYPSGVESGDTGFPPGVELEITDLTPSYLDCEAKICEIGECSMTGLGNKNIYAQSVIITVVGDQAGAMVPRQLKLFCWIK